MSVGTLMRTRRRTPTAGEDGVWMYVTRAKWGVRVIHKSSQMCIQANSECPLVLRHIIKNNSERQGQTPSPPVFWCPLSRCHFFPRVKIYVGQNLSTVGMDGIDEASTQGTAAPDLAAGPLLMEAGSSTLPGQTTGMDIDGRGLQLQDKVISVGALSGVARLHAMACCDGGREGGTCRERAARWVLRLQLNVL
jgi:hypothetical protein